jgi:hypothetical protein
MQIWKGRAGAVMGGGAVVQRFRGSEVQKCSGVEV